MRVVKQLGLDRRGIGSRVTGSLTSYRLRDADTASGWRRTGLVVTTIAVDTDNLVGFGADAVLATWRVRNRSVIKRFKYLFVKNAVNFFLCFADGDGGSVHDLRFFAMGVMAGLFSPPVILDGTFLRGILYPSHTLPVTGSNTEGVSSCLRYVCIFRSPARPKVLGHNLHCIFLVSPIP
jgi:hypothetical protein